MGGGSLGRHHPGTDRRGARPGGRHQPVSYLLNLGAASEVGLDAEQVRGVLAAIAPIVGTPRVAAATGKIVDALDVAIEIAELEEQSER
jgi:hypothetical protein